MPANCQRGGIAFKRVIEMESPSRMCHGFLLRSCETWRLKFDDFDARLGTEATK